MNGPPLDRYLSAREGSPDTRLCSALEFRNTLEESGVPRSNSQPMSDGDWGINSPTLLSGKVMK